MSELVMLLREFGWPVLILIALFTIAFLAGKVIEKQSGIGIRQGKATDGWEMKE